MDQESFALLQNMVNELSQEQERILGTTANLSHEVEVNQEHVKVSHANWRLNLAGFAMYKELMIHRCYLNILRVRSLETHSSYDNLQTKHDMETNLTSIDFSHQGTEGSRSS